MHKLVKISAPSLTSSHLSLFFRADGGSIPVRTPRPPVLPPQLSLTSHSSSASLSPQDRKDLVRNKARTVPTDQSNLRVAQYSLCTLSKVSPPLSFQRARARAHIVVSSLFILGPRVYNSTADPAPCASLSLQRPLVAPIVLDQIGKLYNKVAVLEFLLDRTSYGDGESICGYIRSMKVSEDRSTLSIHSSTSSR